MGGKKLTRRARVGGRMVCVFYPYCNCIASAPTREACWGARWGAFRMMVTKADGTTTTTPLAELGIAKINLRPDVTRVTLPNGRQVFRLCGGATGNKARGMGGRFRQREQFVDRL